VRLSLHSLLLATFYIAWIILWCFGLF
jgi:hypothetical protein